MEPKPSEPLSKLYDILAGGKEEVIVPVQAKTSGIHVHKIEGSTISFMKTKNNFKSADFDTFKNINKSLLPIPKFKLLGKAERRSLGMELAFSQATTGTEEDDDDDDDDDDKQDAPGGMHDIEAERRSMNMKSTSSVQAKIFKEEDEQGYRGRLHDVTVKQEQDRQATADNRWLFLVESNGLYGNKVGPEGL